MHAVRFRLSAIGRLLLGSIVISLVLLNAARPAHATVPPAWFVVDAESGQVLAAQNADELHYPASLTKLMTLYLVFDGIEQEQFTPNQTFSVSRHAAAQEPTKIGVRAGERIAIRDLILALVTQSANDAAVVLGEGIAGSETAFAKRMTAQAKELGMTRTVFRNASGLPDRRQVTTARDMARLARALIRDFPDDYKYFSVKRFHYRGRTFLNHDRLIYRYKGADGMKTGFTNAARFNLVSSALRDDRRLIGVVLGSPSPTERDRKMIALLDRGFATGAAPPAIASRRTGVVAASEIVSALSPISRAEAAVPRATIKSKGPRGWAIQVGVFAQRATAIRFAGEITRKSEAATPHNRRIETQRHKHGRSLYRVQFVDLTHATAESACRALRRHHHECLVVKRTSP
jgi:D-alanyl-D-alanine carboxypeptidase